MLRRPCCGPVRVLGTRRGRSLLYVELRKTYHGNVCVSRWCVTVLAASCFRVRLVMRCLGFSYTA